MSKAEKIPPTSLFLLTRTLNETLYSIRCADNLSEKNKACEEAIDRLKPKTLSVISACWNEMEELLRQRFVLYRRELTLKQTILFYNAAILNIKSIFAHAVETKNFSTLKTAMLTKEPCDNTNALYWLMPTLSHAILRADDSATHMLDILLLFFQQMQTEDFPQLQAAMTTKAMHGDNDNTLYWLMDAAYHMTFKSETSPLVAKKMLELLLLFLAQAQKNFTSLAEAMTVKHRDNDFAAFDLLAYVLRSAIEDKYFFNQPFYVEHNILIFFVFLFDQAIKQGNFNCLLSILIEKNAINNTNSLLFRLVNLVKTVTANKDVNTTIEFAKLFQLLFMQNQTTVSLLLDALIADPVKTRENVCRWLIRVFERANQMIEEETKNASIDNTVTQFLTLLGTMSSKKRKPPASNPAQEAPPTQQFNHA
jgi:hypothetical protein